MIEIKLQSLWNLARTGEALVARNELPPLATLKTARLDPVRRFAINRQIDAIAREVEALEAVRMEAVREYGTERTTPDGNSLIEIKADTPALQQFEQKMRPLLETMVEIPGERMSLSELGDLQIAGDALDALGFLFTEYE